MTQLAVSLVSMPWAAPESPSIALGILHSVLEQHGLPCVTRSYHVAFAEYLQEATRHDARPLTLADYNTVCEGARIGTGDWAFAVPPYQHDDPARDEAYFASASQYDRASQDDLSPEGIRLLRRIRALVPAFLAQCADDVLALRPRIVGFTTTFGQSVASLVLAKILKQRDPGITTVLGGASCEGPMGAALHRNFPWVDVVVRGEGETVFPQLVREITRGLPPSLQPGLCLRTDGRCIEVPASEARVAMSEVPPPNYDEYFDRVAASPIGEDLRVKVQIPYESARGCWWGAKHHCTFCGLNGGTLRFRSKPADQVLTELRELAERHRVLNFQMVDNIIDMGYFGTLLPALERTGWDLRLFFETKANLRLDQIRQFHAAGVRSIQPGIESLSTAILKLMRKGVTSLQNIRLLKWCASYELTVSWNIIYGFPGEPPDEYERMARDMEALVHLDPPGFARLSIDRFSPYFDDPATLGLRITGPRAFYRYLYDVDPASVADIVYFFDAEHLDDRDPEQYVTAARDAVARWRGSSAQARGTLRCRLGPGFLVLDDHRPGLRGGRYVLDGAEAEIFLACDAGATPAEVLRALPVALAADLELSDVRGFLELMLDARLLYREGDKYLSLAIPEDRETYFARCARLVRGHDLRPAIGPRVQLPTIA
jgi:ribosomal peptide maturation radical SAM protein 1